MFYWSLSYWQSQQQIVCFEHTQLWDKRRTDGTKMHELLENFKGAGGWGVHQKNYVAGFGPLKGAFWTWKKKVATNFPKMGGGGQRPFETFPKIHPFWYRHPDMRFVQNFTPPDFQAKNFTLSILHNFNSYSDKNTKNEWNGEIYTAGKKFTLPPAVTAWTNLSAAVTCPFVSKYWLCFWILEILNLKGI